MFFFDYVIKECVDNVGSSIHDWCSGVILLSTDDHVAESRRLVMLVCSSVGLIRIICRIGKLLRIAFEVGVYDERYSQLFLNVFELHSFLLFGKDDLLCSLLVAKRHVLVQSMLCGEGVKAVVAEVLLVFVF